jgi:hypothetical protein
VVRMDTRSLMTRPCSHFVGFRDDAYLRARRVFGPPDFIHPRWDRRARREIADGDMVLFAVGDDTQEPARFNAPDYVEDGPDDLQRALQIPCKL